MVSLPDKAQDSRGNQNYPAPRRAVLRLRQPSLRDSQCGGGRHMTGVSVGFVARNGNGHSDPAQPWEAILAAAQGWGHHGEILFGGRFH